MFVIKWKSGPEKNCSDFLPASWFAAEGHCARLDHEVEGPQKGRSVARCSLDVSGRIADLDYGGAHEAFNERNFQIGTMRLFFADRERRKLDKVQWCDAGKRKTFYDGDVELSEVVSTFEDMGNFNPRNKADGRRRIVGLVTVRQGQPLFRARLMEAYERRCAITGCTIEATLEAAHISPYRGADSNHVCNGLLLRADMHTLFDLGLIKIDAKGRISADDRVRQAYELPETIFLPRVPSLRPDPVALGEKFRQRS